MRTEKKYGTSFFILLSLFLLLLAAPVSRLSAQEGPAKLRELLQKLQRTYSQASYLQFQVEYFYANKKNPAQRMDSLFGQVQMDKARYRYIMDNAETVVTPKYTIQVMRPERSIYVSGARHSGLMDPVGVTDSILAHLEGVTVQADKQHGMETVTMDFPPGKMYTRITMLLDTRTGYLQKVTYDLHTESLVGQELIDKPGHPGPYQSEGQVVVLFNGYHSGGFGEEVFDEHKFFNRVESRFEPAESYKGYHIVLASSNL